MKKILNFLAVFAVLGVLIFSCQKKVGDLPFYSTGAPIELKASSATIAAAPQDSNSTVLTINWTDPKYPQKNPNGIKYIIQIDSAGRQFSKAHTITVNDTMQYAFTAKYLNSVMLDYGFQFNKPYSVDFRIISSYENNNDQQYSNIVTIKMTPYKVPPKIQLPPTDQLYLVGDATIGGWNNPVPVPTQVFSRIDETTYAGIFNLKQGGEYLILPVNGDWSQKYAIPNKSLPGIDVGGTFGFGLNDNWKAPAASGWYKITLDFQTGKYTVTSWTGTLPDNLFMVGDATPGGWNNPVPVPSQQLTRLNSSEFQITLSLNAGKEYLLLPVNGDWSHKYAVADNTIVGLANGGEFGYDFGKNFPAPTVAGNYKINVNFAKGTQGMFTVTKL